MSSLYDAFMSTDVDDEVFLSEAPIALLQQSITQQFEDPIDFKRKDYVQTFITKYNYSKENMKEDSDLEELDDLQESFVAFMLDTMEKYLGVVFPDIDEESIDDMHECIHITYRFFIKNIKRNFVNMMLNYINKHKDELLDSLPRKKDVAAISFKEAGISDDDIVILSNMDSVINYILGLKDEIFAEDFFDLCDDNESCLELEYVKEKFDKDKITGNFVPLYFDMVDENFKIEIGSKLRSKILSDYPLRKKEKIKIKEDLDSIEDNSDEIED